MLSLSLTLSLSLSHSLTQARVNRQEFSAEGVAPFLSEPPKRGSRSQAHSTIADTFTSPAIPLRYSHFTSLNSDDVLQAATEDLVRIFQLKVSACSTVSCQ